MKVVLAKIYTQMNQRINCNGKNAWRVNVNVNVNVCSSSWATTIRMGRLRSARELLSIKDDFGKGAAYKAQHFHFEQSTINP